MKENFGDVEAILASDGFFPFPDIVKICAEKKKLEVSFSREDH